MLLSFFLALDVSLVAFLGADEQRIRDAAETILAARGWPARPALEHGRTSKDPAIRHRCESLYERALGSLLRSFEPLPEIDAAWYDAWPKWWTGRVPCYHETRFSDRYYRMVPYLDAVGRDKPPWDNYYRATALWLRAEIEAGTNLDDLRALLDEMHARDRAFLWRYWHQP